MNRVTLLLKVAIPTVFTLLRIQISSSAKNTMSLLPNSNRYKTLLVATTLDSASMNLATALTKRNYFQKVTDELWHSDHSLLWIQNESLLRLDYVNKLCQNRFQLSEESCTEVIFLSKHKAASGTASLTVHPIGIPWQTENEKSGGLPGKCSPPNHRIATLYREVLEETKRRSMDSRFQITQEATHHGPYVEIPTCFVEIGSTEVDWLIPEAGEVWADVLIHNLSLQSDIEYIRHVSDRIRNELVVITIGGGHYVPRMNDLARLGEHIYTGHALTTYALESYLEEKVENPLPGGWRGIINEMVESTRISYPYSELICILDKKSFKAQYKNDIISHLESIGVKWTHSSSDVKTLYNNLQTKISSSSSSSSSLTEVIETVNDITGAVESVKV